MLIPLVAEAAMHSLSLGIDVQARGVADVCAQAPQGVRPHVNEILGWIKYGVIAIIIGAGFVSTGALVVGKFGQMGRAAQVGAGGLMWTVLGAIAFVTIYAILNGIVGAGC